MGFTKIDLDRLVAVPRFTADDLPEQFVLLDASALPQPSLRARPDAWIVAEIGDGLVHLPAVKHSRAAMPTGEHLQESAWRDADMAWRELALSVHEMAHRAAARAKEPFDQGPKIQEQQWKPLRPSTGHTLVVAVRTAPCCGRLTQIAMRTLFDGVRERHLLRTEPLRACPPKHHPEGDLEFGDIEHQLRQRFLASERGGEDVLVWGPAPVLAIYAELVHLHRPKAALPHTACYWLKDTTDLQAGEAYWRAGAIAPFRLAQPPRGEDVLEDADLMIAVLNRIAASRRARLQDRKQEIAARRGPVPVDDGTLVLPTALGKAQTPPAGQWTGRPDAELTATLPEGPTDAVRVTTARREQSILRRILLHGRTEAPCDLCGTVLPAWYLRTAHIKKRALTDENERLDLNNVMLACTLGCDQLFELGDLFVDYDGMVRARAPRTSGAGAYEVGQAAKQLDGRRCAAHSDSRRPYFRQHRLAHGVEE